MTVHDSVQRPNILVAYDGSPATRRAVELAIDCAKAKAGDLTVVVATKRSPRYGETMAEVRQALKRSNQAQKRLVNEIAALCAERTTRPIVHVAAGRALPETLRAGRKQHYGVIVLPRLVGPAAVLCRLAARRAQQYADIVAVPPR